MRGYRKHESDFPRANLVGHAPTSDHRQKCQCARLDTSALSLKPRVPSDTGALVAASCTVLLPRLEVGRNPELLRICTVRRKGLTSSLRACGEVVHEICGSSWGYVRRTGRNPRRHRPRTEMPVQRAPAGQVSVRVLDDITHKEAQGEHQQTEHQEQIPVEAGVLVD